ncbi:hypothetical protein CQ046_13835 [Chryseobacterium sp. MYb7]|uniref:hypothetical protein n=1 Tax=Chryseobacterium sp. MYb7 TaxID=1827290 RepID=UPI000D0070AF|nr:hypothetical protein [Chryseobacterium sp. MYb7]PRB02039.1 hypothetical protein CQ046_13835 [Chryseobacterium sp. MYb7]
MEIKIYNNNTFIFKIVVPKNDKNNSIEGIMTITNKLPSTIQPQFVKIQEEEVSQIYCISNNHSDYISLESRIGYEVISL